MKLLEEWVHAVLRGLALGSFIGAFALGFTKDADEILILRYIAYSLAASVMAIAWRPR